MWIFWHNYFRCNYKVPKLAWSILLHGNFPFVKLKVIENLVCWFSKIKSSRKKKCFLIFEVNKEEKELFEKKKETGGGQFVNPVDDPNRTISTAKAKVLQNVDTFFYIGTEVKIKDNCLFYYHHERKNSISKRYSCSIFILNEVILDDDSWLIDELVDDPNRDNRNNQCFFVWKLLLQQVMLEVVELDMDPVVHFHLQYHWDVIDYLSDKH